MQSRTKVNPQTALTAAEKAVLGIIENHNALVRVTPDIYYDENRKPVIDYSAIDEDLQQILDPTNNRPSRSEAYFSYDTLPMPKELRKINLLTNKSHIHQLGMCRHTKHKGMTYEHTLKMASTLLPPEPQYMRVFDEAWIGFLWDITACKIKDKYIWHLNACTDLMYWYDIDDDDHNPEMIIKYMESFCSLEYVRAKNNKTVADKTIIDWNEFLAGLPKGRVDALFTPQDTLDMRLRAWNAMIHTKEFLGLKENLPVLVMEAGKPHRIYTAAEHAKDLQEPTPQLTATPYNSLSPLARKKFDRKKVKRVANNVTQLGFFQPQPTPSDLLLDLGCLAIALSIGGLAFYASARIDVAMLAGLITLMAIDQLTNRYTADTSFDEEAMIVRLR